MPGLPCSCSCSCSVVSFHPVLIPLPPFLCHTPDARQGASPRLDMDAANICLKSPPPASHPEARPQKSDPSSHSGGLWPATPERMKPHGAALLVSLFAAQLLRYRGGGGKNAEENPRRREATGGRSVSAFPFRLEDGASRPTEGHGGAAGASPALDCGGSTPLWPRSGPLLFRPSRQRKPKKQSHATATKRHQASFSIRNDSERPKAPVSRQLRLGAVTWCGDRHGIPPGTAFRDHPAAERRDEKTYTLSRAGFSSFL